MPSPQASRRNLAKVKRLRHHTESLKIKDLIQQWDLVPTQLKGPFKTQAELARRLGVTQQYVSKVAKGALWHCFHKETGRAYWQNTTLEEFDRARQRRLDSCYAPEPPEREADTSDFEQTETGPDLSEESESNQEGFASEPRREYVPPLEVHQHVSAPCRDLMEELRKELRRSAIVHFRIPGFI